MKQKNLNNIINQFLIVFLIIQPIFDLKFFYNSISTLIRVIIIYALFAYYFFASKNKKKYYLLIYPILIGIYFIFHHLNAIKIQNHKNISAMILNCSSFNYRIKAIWD